MSDVTIGIDSFDNGYRPTAFGFIDRLGFIFRMDGSGRWLFAVGTADSTARGEVSWMCDEGDFVFLTDGAGGPVFHTDSLPFFLDGLDQYLRSRGLEADQIEHVIESATEQALAHFASG